MLTRADTISQTQKKLDTYSDFSNNFTKHPVTNQLVTLKNEDSIKQAFKNLILTNISERLFNPFFGSNIRKNLFELETPFLVEDIRNSVILASSQFEKRVQVINISIDDITDQNSISVNIVFLVQNVATPLTITINLRRAR